VLVLVGGGVAAYAATSSSGSRYRTAIASAAQIDQTLSEVGTANAAGSRNYAFSTSGTVASVAVSAGQQVAAGQVLATLDLTSLNNALARAQQTLAAAQLTLENDKTGQTSNSTSRSGAGPVADVTAYPAAYTVAYTVAYSAPTTGPTTTGADPKLAAAQQAVIAAQQLVDTDLAAAKTLLADATTTCNDSTSTAQDCQDAQTAVSNAQTTVSTDETALLSAVQKLSGILAQQAAANATKTPSSGNSGNSGGSGNTPKVASAAQLAADQAAIDAAAAAVAVAQENLARGTLVTSTAGTVMSVGFAPGSTVSANSTTATVLIANPSTVSYQITVPVAALDTVGVGDVATVVPDGSSTKLPAKVTNIGITPTTSGGSSYAVTVSLDTQPGNLRDGSSASVTVTTASVQASVSVPTSALTRTGNAYTVRTFVNGTVTTKPVTVGAMGTALTQIKSGLDDGTVVVLADRGEKLPTSDATNRRGLGGLGGLGGGGLGGGGLGGGGGFTRTGR
jgi:HlyD family secretion protein